MTIKYMHNISPSCTANTTQICTEDYTLKWFRLLSTDALQT